MGMSKHNAKVMKGTIVNESDSPVGHTPGASTLLRIPQGASKFANNFPKCVHALFERVYDGDRTLESTRNEPDDDTDRTWEVWWGGRERLPVLGGRENRCLRMFP